MDREQQLEKALEALADREQAYEAACVDAAQAESEYRIEFAKAYLSASGTIEARHNTAIKECERFLRERDRSTAVKEFTKEKVKDCQLAVSARQSLLSSSRRTSEAFG